MNEMKKPNPADPANRDPITKEPGAHPVGVGVGAAVGGAAVGVGTAAATGAAVGTAAGPIGTVVGAAVGAVVGGLAGKAVAEKYDPTVEDRYWRDNYKSQPGYSKDYTYDDYAPAYRMGAESRSKYAGQTWSEAEGRMSADWDRAKGSSKMTWEHAKASMRAAWDRLTD